MGEPQEPRQFLEHEPVHPPVVVASVTLYRNWYPGAMISDRDTDKLRGDLGIETLGSAVVKGYRVIDVDGGSPEEFRQTLESAGVQVVDQRDKSYGARKRQGNLLAAALNPKAILNVEPEKVSLMNFIETLVEPILNGRADIVIPCRDQAAFDTYPPAQAVFEQKANRLANSILKQHGLLPPDSSDLDLWMGSRMFRNDPEVLKLFQDKYDFRRFNSAIDETIDLEMWPNLSFIPVILALAKGLRVIGVPVNYVHPEIQTKNETGVKEFDRKREIQFKGIIIAIIETVRMLESQSGKSSKATRIIT